MIKKSFFLVLFIISYSYLFSQDSTKTNSVSERFALQFQIDQNFTLSNFQGSVFSGKYNFNKNLAVRVGLSIMGSSSDNTTDNFYDNTLEENSKTDQSVFSTKIATQLLYYLARFNDVSFYLGGGPFYHYWNATNENNTLRNDMPIFSKTERTMKGFGVESVLGVEWFVKDNISLSSEYGFEFRSTDREEKNENRTNEISNNNNLNGSSVAFNASTVKFGLSVYF